MSGIGRKQLTVFIRQRRQWTYKFCRLMASQVSRRQLGEGRFVLQTAAAATAPCRHRPPFSGPNRTRLLPNSLSRQIFSCLSFSCLSFRNSVPFSEFGSRQQHWPLVPTHTQLPLHSCSTCRAYCSRRSPRIRGSEAGQLGHSAALGPGQLPLSRFQEPYPGLFCNLF